MSRKSKSMCSGCRNNFYNDRENCGGGNECWSYKAATVVRRWRLYWWTAPTVAGAYREVEVLSCYHQPGTYAYHETLPDFAVEPQRMGRS